MSRSFESEEQLVYEGGEQFLSEQSTSEDETEVITLRREIEELKQLIRKQNNASNTVQKKVSSCTYILILGSICISRIEKFHNTLLFHKNLIILIIIIQKNPKTNLTTPKQVSFVQKKVISIKYFFYLK